MRFKLSAVLALAATVALILNLAAAPPASAASQSFKRGVQQYRQGKISAARSSFEDAIAEQPWDSFAHYYLGNCLALQGQPRQAVTQYETAKSLNSHPQLQEYCDQAINAFETVELTKDYYAKATIHANKLRAKVAVQLDSQQQMKQQIATKMANNMVEEGNQQAARINAQADADINCMPRWRRGPGAQALSDSIRREAEKRSRTAVQEANYRANCYRKQAQAELDAYRESASNLTALMAAPLNKNGYGLSPYGTNLYVRQYTRTSP